MMRTDACLDCGRPFTYEYSRGRPRTRCDDCKAGRDHHADEAQRSDENYFRPEPKEIP